MGFDPAWLAMREPYDHACRSEALLEAAAAHVGRDATVLDLAGGTGSGARWILTRQSGWQLTVVDHDPELLAVAAAHGHPTLRRDLAQLDTLPEADVITMQALLDLVSWDWLDDFAAWLDRRRVPLLAALTVDGRQHFHPAIDTDAGVLDAFRAHQRLDRGFGPSPGVEAAPALVQRLERLGWRVTAAQTDWEIPATDAAMLSAMVDGIAEAARVTHAAPDAVEAWRTQRQQHVARAQVGLRVGHLDLLALPPA